MTGGQQVGREWGEAARGWGGEVWPGVIEDLQVWPGVIEDLQVWSGVIEDLQV